MSKKRRPDEMLDDYMAGTLDQEGIARVEHFLAEVEEQEAPLLAKVRASELRPKQEPDWDAMLGGITRACDQEDEPALSAGSSAKRRRASPRGWRSILRPRFAIGFASLATAAAVLVSMQLGQGGSEGPETAVSPGDAGVAMVARAVAKQPTELRDAALDDLDNDELDRVFESLRPDQMGPDSIAREAGAGQSPVLAPELVAEWTNDDPSASDDDHLGLGLFSDSNDGTNYDDLLDTLDDDALDRVDAELAAHGGKAG